MYTEPPDAVKCKHFHVAEEKGKFTDFNFSGDEQLWVWILPVEH